MRFGKATLITLLSFLLSLKSSVTHAGERIMEIGRFGCQTAGEWTLVEFKNGRPITSNHRQDKASFTIDYKFYFLTMDGNAPMLWDIKSTRKDIYWYGKAQGYDSVGLAQLFDSSFVFGSPQSARISLVRHYRNDWSGFVVNTLEVDEGSTIIEPVTCTQSKGFNGF